MGNRRDKPAADAFGGGEDYDLETVANALYGKNDHLIEQADRERVVRRQVALKEIYIDPNIQVRVGGLNEEHVEALAQVDPTGPEWAFRSRVGPECHEGVGLAATVARVDPWRSSRNEALLTMIGPRPKVSPSVRLVEMLEAECRTK